MRTLTLLFLIGLSPWATAKEFKMPCAEYEQLTGEKVCDIAPMIPTSTEEIEAIKQRQKYESCIADFKSKYPQCFPAYHESTWGKKRELPDECYISKDSFVKKSDQACPAPKSSSKQSTPPKETNNVWG